MNRAFARDQISLVSGAFIISIPCSQENARDERRHDGARQYRFGDEGKFANGAKFYSTTCRLRLLVVMGAENGEIGNRRVEESYTESTEAEAQRAQRMGIETDALWHFWGN